MARAVKEIPVLTGEDAKRFSEAMKADESNKVSREEYERIKNNFNKFEVRKA